MKKRLFEITLAAIITTGIFTGCGKSQAMQTAATETTVMETIAETESQTAEPETEPQTEPEKMVYTDDYTVPVPDEVFNMLDNGAILFDNSELSEIPLNDRQGKTYIELCVVQVKDIETGEGKILNSFDEYRSYCYIGDMPEYDLQNGDIIAKYFVYNPQSNAEDDIIKEYSMIVEK